MIALPRACSIIASSLLGFITALARTSAQVANVGMSITLIFGILGGDGYNTIEWGNLYPWAYTFPRKTLRITGAPTSKFSKTHALPKRPWGVEADDIFLSMQSVPDASGGLLDLSGEVLTRHSSKPFIISLNASELTDDDFRRHIRHPEFLNRHMIANMATGLTADPLREQRQDMHAVGVPIETGRRLDFVQLLFLGNVLEKQAT